MGEAGYIPALRFRWLTRIYDPLLEQWTAAAQMRETVIEVRRVLRRRRLRPPGRLAGLPSVELMSLPPFPRSPAL